MDTLEFPRSGWPANVYTGELRYVVEDFEAVDQVLYNETMRLMHLKEHI